MNIAANNETRNRYTKIYQCSTMNTKWLLLLSIFILSSCSSPQPKPTKKEPVPQKETEDLRNPLVTPDLTFFELKGPIKCLLGNYYYLGSDKYDSIFFDREGFLSAIYISGIGSRLKSPYASEDNFRGYFRDEKTGQFSRFNGFDGQEDFYWENGRVHVRRYWAEGHTTFDTLYYNDRGQLRKRISVCWGAEDQPDWTDAAEYKYQVIDKYGNWTRRMEIRQQSAVYHDGELVFPACSDTVYQRRRFFYY